ncbi:hypothetical protein B0J11DRAFT_582072 [Dendryphion nanum]|uniref:BTB domain-containing protein n=1 Tax=Dendryphion nanum TaxID=256645 RepID=A0A9P9IHI1_9PLEO|nr:hypothetical protein B0J11DRAFT_582072 [Dendryphion nanum]
MSVQGKCRLKENGRSLAWINRDPGHAGCLPRPPAWHSYKNERLQTEKEPINQPTKFANERSPTPLLNGQIPWMPNKARNKRRQEEKAELKRRRAQSERDKAAKTLQDDEWIDRLAYRIEQSLALRCQAVPLAIKPSSSTVLEGIPPSISQASIMQARSDKFMRNVAGLFNSLKYSDATILIHDVKLPVHKSIICIQSEYFEKAFQETFVEGASGLLTFNDGSGAAYWRVFEYLYTGDYSDDLSKDFEDDSPLLKDPRVYALADIFFLKDLKTLSTTKLQRKLQDLWTSDSFPECIREVYASTPSSDRAIRSTVVEVVSVRKLDLGKKAIFKDLIHEGGDFVVDYFERITSLELDGTSETSGTPQGFRRMGIQ